MEDFKTHSFFVRPKMHIHTHTHLYIVCKLSNKHCTTFVRESSDFIVTIDAVIAALFFSLSHCLIFSHIIIDVHFTFTFYGFQDYRHLYGMYNMHLFPFFPSFACFAVFGMHFIIAFFFFCADAFSSLTFKMFCGVYCCRRRRHHHYRILYWHFFLIYPHKSRTVLFFFVFFKTFLFILYSQFNSMGFAFLQ